MEELTLQDLMIINKGVLRPGEPFAILDQGKLESALGNQYYGYLYGSNEQAIAALYRAIVINHGFANGNKRTAVVAAKFLADSIGAKFALDDQGLIDFTYEVASDGGSRLDTNYITNKLFGTDLPVEDAPILEDANHGDKVTIENVQNWLKTNGATISCEDKCAVVYDEGYELSFDGTEIQIHGLNFDDLEDVELVKATIDKRLEAATYPYVGLWVDNGIVYIDYSEHILDRKEAFESGIDSNQLSMFNWGYPHNGDPKYIDLVELRKKPLTESVGTDLCKLRRKVTWK